MSTDLQQPEQRKSSGLPRFLSFSIYALIGLTLLTIVALFVDSIDGKGIRITMTFAVFAAFVGLTAWDTLRESSKSWYPPAALLSNGLFLGASLLTIWLTPDAFTVLFGGTVVVIGYAIILRLALFFGILAMSAVDRSESGQRAIEPYEHKSSIAAAWLAGVAAALFVIYIAAKSILSSRIVNSNLDGFWDLYLKVSVSVLILAGLALSVSLLLRWFFGAEERRIAKASRPVELSSAGYGDGREEQFGGGSIRTQDNSYPQQSESESPTTAVPEAPAEARIQEPLPWPKFPDGNYYPAGADGQPDFERAKLRIEDPSSPWNRGR